MSYFIYTATALALVLLFAIFKTLHDILHVLDDMEFELRGKFGNAVARIHIGSWYPFKGLGGNKVSQPDTLENHVKNSLMDVNGSYYSTAESASTDTALSSASYRGATQVTINIYQMSPVVGDNGMREFAAMIREEFEALDYYGVSA